VITTERRCRAYSSPWQYRRCGGTPRHRWSPLWPAAAYNSLDQLISDFRLHWPEEGVEVSDEPIMRLGPLSHSSPLSSYDLSGSPVSRSISLASQLGTNLQSGGMKPDAQVSRMPFPWRVMSSRRGWLLLPSTRAWRS